MLGPGMLREKLRPEESRKACLRRQKEEAGENSRPVVMRCTGSVWRRQRKQRSRRAVSGER